MKLSDNRNSYRSMGSRVGLDLDVNRFSPIIVKQLALADARHAALYVCGRASDTADAVMLCDMLGLTKQLVDARQLVE